MILKILYKIYSFCIALPIFVVATIVTATVIMIATLFGDKDNTDYFMSKWWSRLTCRVFLLGIHVEGREVLDRHQSYVFLANHQGYFDIFLTYGYLGHKPAEHRARYSLTTPVPASRKQWNSHARPYNAACRW